MANRLSMANINAIQTLHQSGHSNRKISKLLGVDRGSVNNYVRKLQNPPNAPTGSQSDSPPSSPGPESACQPYLDVIRDMLDKGLSAQRIFQDLRTDYGFTASYYSVRRFVARLQEKTPLPVRRIETATGQEAQIDFGTAAHVVDADGKLRRPWLFRVVLSHSRKAYSEAVWRQTTDEFIAALENAFHYFGGVPKTLVIDNLKAAVARADWYDPEVHPKLQSFATHYGTAFLPTKPYTPQHKGKIENGVKYAKNLEGAAVQQPRRAERASAAVGTERGRHSYSRHNQATGRQTVREVGTKRVVAIAARSVPVVSRGPPHGQSRRACGSG